MLIHSKNEYHQVLEFLWSMSIWLEAVAIVPQLFIVYRLREVQMITGSYMAALGFYRLLYICHWYLHEFALEVGELLSLFE